MAFRSTRGVAILIFPTGSVLVLGIIAVIVLLRSQFYETGATAFNKREIKNFRYPIIEIRQEDYGQDNKRQVHRR